MGAVVLPMEEKRISEDRGAAVARLVELTGSAYRLAAHVVGSPEAAEDVVQGAYLEALSRLRPGLPPEKERTWFLTTVVNRARDHLRGEARRRRREAAVTREREGMSSAPDAADARGAALSAALAALEAKYRLPLALCYEEGLSQREAAAVLNVPERTLSDRLRHGLERLRHALSRAGYAAVPAAVVGVLRGSAAPAPAALADSVRKLAARHAAPRARRLGRAGRGAGASAKGGLAMKIVAGIVAAGAVMGWVAISTGSPEVAGRSERAPLAATGAKDDAPVPVNPQKEMQKREEVFEFAEKPKAVREGDKVVITFASKAKCDATVAIVGPDGRTVCHLASGVLGPNAPYPLQQGTLAQKLAWDGLDDQGKPAPRGCKVRVSLGLKAEFAWTAPMHGAIKDEKGELTPQRSLSAEQAKAWPKVKTPEGDEVLIPGEVKRTGVDRKGKTFWDNNFRYQVAVDPLREEIYASGGQVCFNGTWKRLDGKTGKWDPGFSMKAMEVAVHPSNGLLYVRDMKSKPKRKEMYGKDWGCHFLSRRDRTGRIIKFTIPEADPDGEVFMPSDRSAKNFGDGFAFSPNGDLYVLADIRAYPAVKYQGRPGPSVIVYDAEGNQKPWRKTVFTGTAKPRKSVDKDGKESKDFGKLAEIPAGGSCGIGADRFGNFYVGSNARPTGRLYPDDMVGSPDLPSFNARYWTGKDKNVPAARFLQLFTGSVIKFPPTGGKLSSEGEPTHWYWGNTSNLRKVRLEGPLWTFVGITPITTQTMSCICQQARISVDAWGRVLVPQTHRQSVLVLDPQGNTVLRVGKFGNAETKGLFFTTPKYVAASDTGLYVADRALGRVLKAKLSYEVEEEAPLP